MDLGGDGHLSSLGGDEDISNAFKNNDQTSANDDNNLRVSSTTPKLPVMGPMRGQMKIAKLGVPKLDFSNLKTVKEYKDWYGYS